MNNCSYGISIVSGFTCFSSVIVSVGVPYSCMLCCAYADCGWLFLTYRICSRHLVLRFPPVCPMYALLQVLHVILYTPLLSRSCVASGFRVFVLCCIVFVVLNVILMSVFFNRFVIVLTFALWYVNVSIFSFVLWFSVPVIFVLSVSLVLLLSVGILVVFGYNEDLFQLAVSLLDCQW
jgi:hypothetical protein